MFTKQTIRDADVANRRVLVRVDWNVPGDENGSVEDDWRIMSSLPTLKYLLNQHCAVIVISHRGRPSLNKEPAFSLRPCAELVATMLNSEVLFVDDTVGEKAQAAVDHVRPGQLLVLENLRYDERETANDAEFAQQLASYGEVFVQDGFGVVHRAHASTQAITEFIPSYSGLLLESEYNAIVGAVHEPTRPLLAIIGGAKVADKIHVLDEFIDAADEIVVGGAMANTFLRHPEFGGHRIGTSLAETHIDDELDRLQQQLIAQGKRLILPYRDVAVGHSVDDSTRREIDHTQVANDDMILDFGAQSVAEVVAAIDRAETIVWNGPIGLFENPAFAHGSETIARAIAESSATTVVGGGDTDELIDNLGLRDRYDHVSTGGGASLELMAGEALPGIEALRDVNERS